MKKNVKIDESYFLTTQTVGQESSIQEQTKNVNHIIVIDVSGSMSWDLPQIRKNLKNKLSSLVKEGDTVTIIWFSGRNDAGILKEEVEVHSVKQLNDLNDAIDKWLVPIGLTAFAKPLELAKDVIMRVSTTRPGTVFSLIFMSDGWNNNCEWSSVINALKELAPILSSSVMVEYGWSADSQRLTEMAGILGGEKISCANFEEYDAVVSNTLSTSLKGGKKVVVDIEDPFLYDFAFSVTDTGGVILYNLQMGEHGVHVLVNADVKEIHYFSPVAVGLPVSGKLLDNTALYAAIYVLADKLLNDDAEKIFYALGDNFYYKELLNAFGKQKLNAFKASIKECVADVAKRFPEGQGNIQKVPEDAYCLMNLIEDLGNLDNCLFYPSHPDWSYNRVSMKRVQKSDNLSDADKARLANAKNVAEMQAITAELAESNVNLKFEDSEPNKGYGLGDLVWNSERANLSVRIKIDGKVILPKNKFNLESVPTSRYNTFTLLKDGIVNVKKLPVSYSDELFHIVNTNGIKADISDDFIVLDLTSLPIINRAMVHSISATELAKQEWELYKLKGEAKVYDGYRKVLFPKESKSYLEAYGQEATDWLKEIGITDYNGFAPKSEAGESTDFYMSVNLATKIKGLSSLPKLEDVEAKVTPTTDAKSFTKLGEAVMVPAIVEYQQQLESPVFKAMKEADQKLALQTYLIKKSKESIAHKRAVMQQIAEIKFSLILSKRWFKEFSTFEDNKLSLNIDGRNLDFTFDLFEEEVKI